MVEVQLKYNSYLELAFINDVINWLFSWFFISQFSIRPLILKRKKSLRYNKVFIIKGITSLTSESPLTFAFLSLSCTNVKQALKHLFNIFLIFDKYICT